MKQIRVFLDDVSYNELKKASKELRMTLGQVAGLKLRGFRIIHTKTEREQQNQEGK